MPANCGTFIRRDVLNVCSILDSYILCVLTCKWLYQARLQNCEKRLLASSCLSVCLSTWNNLSPTGQILTEVLYLRIFRKSIEKIQVCLKSEKNNGYFMLRNVCLYNNISLNCSRNEKYCRQRLCCLWDNVEECGRGRQATDDNITGRMRFACGITNASHTIRIRNTYCLYSACLVLLYWLCVFQFWAHSFVCFCREQSCGRKNPNARHVVVMCSWCQMCDWPQLVII